MKRILPLLAILVTSAFYTFASHNIGGEISYVQAGPNTYQVNFTLYRDCFGANTSATHSINVMAPGCNTGRNIMVNKISERPGRPFGPGTPIQCSPTSSLPNFEIINYTGLLTFSAAEAACQDWVLSWSECCWGNMENVVNASGLSVYTETKLKLTPGLVNSSPAFDTLSPPVMYVNVGQLYNLNQGAIDPDGDSLVYSLVSPLSAANTPVTYSPNTNFSIGSAGIITNPNPKSPFGPFNPQFAQLQGSPPVYYSPNYPLNSYTANWDGPPTVPYPNSSMPGGIQMIWPAYPLFQLNAVNGDLKFQPVVMHPGTTASAGRNRYLVSILVDEYRKINGVVTKIGSARRETMIQVFSNPARNPEFGTVIANNQAVANGTEIRLRPGTPLVLQFTATEPTNSQLSVSSNASYILPGSAMTAPPALNIVSGTLTWTPTAAHVRWQPYYFQIMVRDEFNLRGVHVETVAVRVSATGGVTGTKDELAKAGFMAYPNPFSSDLNFRLNLKTKAESIIIYNLLGQQVDKISLTNIGVGEQQLQWPNAGKYAAGTYVAKLVSGDKTVQTIKFTKLQ